MPDLVSLGERNRRAERASSNNILLLSLECDSVCWMARDTRTASLPFGPATEKLLAAPKKTKPPSRVQHRLIEAAASIVENDESELCFQHTVFCQTGLPYRDPAMPSLPAMATVIAFVSQKGGVGKSRARSRGRRRPTKQVATSPPPKPGEPAAYARIDGRLRRSGRTLQLATRVSPESTPGCG